MNEAMGRAIERFANSLNERLNSSGREIRSANDTRLAGYHIHAEVREAMRVAGLVAIDPQLVDAVRESGPNQMLGGPAWVSTRMNLADAVLEALTHETKKPDPPVVGQFEFA